jgi:hypothetical protein
MELEEKHSVLGGTENYRIDDVDIEAYLLKSKNCGTRETIIASERL